MPSDRARTLRAGDVPAWRVLRALLWPEMSETDNASETAAALDDPNVGVFVVDSAHGLAGFIEASLRKYADGCATSPVGYIEGWYVAPECRGTGVGRRLAEAAEAWACTQGCTEMASDSLLDNVDSQRAHERLGYEEVERAVRFRKDIGKS
jgi:aminoglycoside 6'-N-acetyltransferase I